jgi:hypothetical protein
MKLSRSFVYAGLAASGVLATDKLTPDAVEADIHEDK